MSKQATPPSVQSLRRQHVRGSLKPFRNLEIVKMGIKKERLPSFREQALSYDVLYDFQQDLVHVLCRFPGCEKLISEIEHGADQQPLFPCGQLEINQILFSSEHNKTSRSRFS